MKKKIILFSIFILAVSFLTYCFLPFITYNPSSENLPWRIFLTDRNWIVITDKANENGYKKNIKIDLGSKFVKSLIQIEDANYYNHFWIDIISKLWALKNNIKGWKITSWWSTITEQYIKNKYFTNNKRTYLQKLREATLSIYFSIFKINQLKNKEIILNKYLEQIYFWNNLYWLWAALEVYFDKNDLEKLTDEEIILLISLIHNPWVKSLKEENFKNYFEKIKAKLWYKFEKTITKLNKKENIDIFPFVTNNKNIQKLWKATIDLELQQYAKDILNKTLDELKDKNVTNWAIFAINPKTKEVLLYQWSRDFNSKVIDWQVDVIQSFRQPWSTMKPFLYLYALEKWANPDDLVVDLENQYNSFKDWKIYISNNYSLNEYGLVRFKKALWNSLNNASVRLAKELGLENVYNFYKKYNFKLDKTAEYYWYSLVLWNPSIKLEDLVWSYSKLIPKFSHFAKSTLYKREEEDNEINKFLLYDILSNPDNRDLSFWVNSILNTSIDQAVKTWTSTDFRDNVIISYHPDFVIWIWIGNNDNSSMVWVTWITWAWYIWHNIIEKAIELWYIKNVKIEVPDWVNESNYCLDLNCYRKELIYTKNNKNYSSRIMDQKYSKKDLFEKISDEEIERLKDFQIYFDK